MSNSNIGKKNFAVEGDGRDCIHVAIKVVTVGEEWMNPGQVVRLKLGTNDTILRADYGGGIGFIDPQLVGSLTKGDRVYLYLFQGIVTGMRHQWEHPLFDTTPEQFSLAEQWLMNFADKWGFDYTQMIETAINPSGGADYITAVGRDLHGAGELGDDLELFWKNISELTGREFDFDHREQVSWSCSC